MALRAGAFLALVCGIAMSGSGAFAQVTYEFSAEAAPDWTALFDTNSGWSGADGIYAIPLSGIDAPGSATAQSRTVFVFSDTFVGNVNAQGERMPGTVMINNTMAMLRGPDPISARMKFYYPVVNGNPRSVLIPNTQDSRPGDWYWLQDGIAVNGKLQIFTLRMEPGDGGVFNFKAAGVGVVTKPIANPRANWQQADAPLFVPGDGVRGDLIFGCGFMANTVEAGAPDPDGFIYVYGTQNDPLVKKLLAARVTPAEFEDFSAWRYWNGSGWGTDINSAAPITSRVSSELSVTPLGNGNYLAVFQLDTLSDNVAVRVGESPVGPFGPVQIVWSCPESNITPDSYVYNAKAHPHLSKPGELLVSYNVNSFTFGDHFQNADIYRPRFIRLKIAER